MRHRLLLLPLLYGPALLFACVGDTATTPVVTNDAQAQDSTVADVAQPSDGNVPDTSTNKDASGCLPQPVGIISMYTADNVLTDSLGKNPLTWVGGAEQYAPAEVNAGFQLNSKEYLSNLTPKGLDNLAAFTIEGWVQPFDTLGHNLVKRSNGTTGWNMTRQSGGGYRFELVLPDAAPVFSYGMTTSFSTSTLTHVAMTFTALPATVQWYVDGKTDGPPTKLFPDGGSSVLPATGFELRVAEFLNGILDELTLYGRALAPNEIQAIYAAGVNGKCR